MLIGGAGLTWFVVKKSNAESKTKQAALYNQGSKDFAAGKFSDATKKLENAAELEPNDPKTHLSLAKSYESLGKLDKAAAEYKKHLELNPGNAEAHYNLAMIYRSQRKADQAISELKNALKIRKDFVAAKLMLAQTLAGQGKNQEAADEYQSVIKMNPFGTDLAQVHVDLGTALSRLGNKDQAKAEWKKALEIDPNNAQALLFLQQ